MKLAHREHRPGLNERFLFNIDNNAPQRPAKPPFPPIGGWRKRVTAATVIPAKAGMTRVRTVWGFCDTLIGMGFKPTMNQIEAAWEVKISARIATP